jgi:hypothetical protein
LGAAAVLAAAGLLATTSVASTSTRGHVRALALIPGPDIPLPRM